MGGNNKAVKGGGEERVNHCEGFGEEITQFRGRMYERATQTSPPFIFFGIRWKSEKFGTGFQDSAHLTYNNEAAFLEFLQYLLLDSTYLEGLTCPFLGDLIYMDVLGNPARTCTSPFCIHK